MIDPTNATAAMGVMAGMLALSPMIAWAEKAAPARVITCERPFDRSANHNGLVKAFRKDVVYQEVDGAEGAKIKASVLYPQDPKARLEIHLERREGTAPPCPDQGEGSIELGHRERHSHRHDARRG
jgi:hypothetical protein